MVPSRNLCLFSLTLSLLALSPLLAALATTPVPGEPEEGTVIEEVDKGWAADRAGIRAGDLIVTWSRGGEIGGPVRSPFDLHQLQVEQAPHGIVTLQGMREDRNMEWTLSPGSWYVEARPTFPEAILALYRQGREQISKGDLDGGAESWRSAIAAADRRNDPLGAAWLQGRLTEEFAAAGRWPEAGVAVESADKRLEESQTLATSLLLCSWTWKIQNSDHAESCYHRTLALEPEESLAAAWALSSLGDLANRRGDLATAEDLYRKAYSIQERLAPGSIDLAWNLESLAQIAMYRNELDIAEKDLFKALEIKERLAPESLEISTSLGNLGRLALIQGDLSTAEERYQRVLDLTERLDPDELGLAMLLSDMGTVAMYRGHLAIAEERFRRALAIRERLAPKSLDKTRDLINLGRLSEKRGDLAAAEDYYRHSLDIHERLAVGSLNIYSRLFSLYHLAAIEKLKGNWAKADEYLQRILEIQERISPEGYEMASVCSHRADVAVERGNLVLAEEFQVRALAIMEKQSSGSLFVSDSLERLGTIALKRGDLRKAEELFRRALTIREELAPGSTRGGLSLNNLGLVYRQAGNLSLAAEHFCRATEAFDRQRAKLGNLTEGSSTFGGTTAEYYQDCVTAQVALGRPEKAFWALERGRARSFLDLLAKRDMRLTELPLKLAQDRKQTNAEYDRTQAALARLNPEHDRTEINRLLVRLRELEAQQEEITAKVRLASPRTAALHNPQPLNIAGARESLDPGTTLLEYSVGSENTWLFVVQPARASGPGLLVFRITMGAQALREEVESFRRLLKRPGSERAALQIQAQRLYDLLLRPAEAQIAQAQRLLFSPDGPLHTLPFAVLMRGDRYLIEWKPIHSVLSATIYAELARSRPAQREIGEESLVAFGDPAYPPKTPKVPVDPEVREAVRRGLALKPLPYSRKEVEGIAALYPQARVYLGLEATEEKAKSLKPDSRLVHFACHGLLDERFPLNSALALTLPEQQGEDQDNGLLQAWEIFENVRLDADLVTLSACDTALGKEMGGEGLVGLTRAFQYAGARSVLASLWGVSDRSTADLMKRFYGYLKAGRSKDEALHAAQVDLIRNKSFAHPYHWAAFQLTGDWR